MCKSIGEYAGLGKVSKFSYVIPIHFKLDSDTDKDYCINPPKDREEKEIDFEIYPNPAIEYITIDISNFQSYLEYQVINLKGQNLKSGRIYNPTEHINISDLETGLYIIQLITNENRLINTQRLIKE